MTREGRLASAAYSGMFGFGIAMALLGAVLPFLMQRVGFDIAQAGTLFLPMNATMLVVSLAIGPLLDRFGMKPPLAAAPLLVGAALLLMASATSYGALAASVVVLGAGGAALNSTTNTLVADLHADPQRKSAALNLLGVFFGFGALCIPFTIGALIEHIGLNQILYAAIALVLVTTALAVPQRFPRAKQGEVLRVSDVARLVRNPLVLSFAFLLFFESGNEFILGGFTTTYLQKEVQLPETTAAYLLAGYWGAMMVARIAFSRVLLVVRGELLIVLSAVGTALGIGLLLLSHTLPIVLVAVLMIGSCTSAIFPTTLGLAAARFAERSGSVFGILISVALAGGMTLPWIVGRLAATFSLRGALLVAVADTIAIAGLIGFYRRCSR